MQKRKLTNIRTSAPLHMTELLTVYFIVDCIKQKH